MKQIWNHKGCILLLPCPPLAPSRPHCLGREHRGPGFPPGLAGQPGLLLLLSAPLSPTARGKESRRETEGDEEELHEQELGAGVLGGYTK